MFNLKVAHDTYLVYLNMETIIEGNVSIVLGIDTDTITAENSERYFEILDAYANNSGIKEFRDSKGLVRVRCESLNLGINDLSNWAKFGIDAFVDNTVTGGELLALRDNYRFPSYLPRELFEGRKEGEVVSFASKWGEVCLHLCQDKWQTGNTPPFQVVLNKLFQN